MKHDGFVHRADLLLALANNDASAAYLAQQLGFDEKVQDVEILAEKTPIESIDSVDFSIAESKEPVRSKMPDIPFWQVVSCVYFDLESTAITSCTLKKPSTPNRTQEPKVTPITAWSQLLPKLRCALSSHAVRGAKIDFDQILQRVSRAEFIENLPRAPRRAWGCELQLIIDRSTAMTSFISDTVYLYQQLKTVFPNQSIEVAEFHQGEVEPLMHRAKGKRRAYQVPASGTLVIAFSEMGLYSNNEAQQFWLNLGQRLRDKQCQTLAILPTTMDTSGLALSQLWSCVAWNAQRHHKKDQHQLDRLMILLSPATRIDVGFLRDVRQLIDADGSIESLFWQDERLISRSNVAATLDPEVAQKLRLKFKEEPEYIRKSVLAALYQWRTHLPPEIRYEEFFALPQGSPQFLPVEEEAAAKAFFHDLATRVQNGEYIEGLDSWFRALEQRLGDSPWEDSEIKADLHQISALIHQNESDAIPKAGYDPKYNQLKSQNHLRTYHLYQHNQFLKFQTSLSNSPQDSYLGQLQSRNGEFVIKEVQRDSFWLSGQAPSWADDWGEDQYGRWVEFSIKEVTQRMRWIPAGKFLMSSPENEEGRRANEGPQHEVEITQGHWMCDTAVTQALWYAVMGENPSRFKGENLPVEQISWHDCKRFFEKLHQVKKSLDLNFPSEALWEYTCRAGTNTAYHFGGDMNPEQANYDANVQQTVAVKRFQPNEWGLWQMYGNVWEWCLDVRRDYKKERVSDPIGSLGGAPRVLRGGSWVDLSHRLRSASRDGSVSVNRSAYIGFRCSRVQEGAEPIEPRQLRSGTRRAATARIGAAAQHVVKVVQDAQLAPMLKFKQVEIRSDMGQVQLLQTIKPKWASAMGRDAYGLWSEFELDHEGQIIKQRMRWIPAGQFMMGSPEDEAEREDDELQHLVVLSQGYWLFDTAVTQALWVAVMGDNPSNFKDNNLPVNSVSWHDCQSFIDEINQACQLNLSFPTESQWEYACRAGTTTAFNLGSQITTEQVNYNANYPYSDGEKGESRETTVAVKSFRPNDWGLWQMHGNVWEWCLDARRDSSKEQTVDPIGKLGSTSRVLRGGSWFSDERDSRSAYYFESEPDDRNYFIGFRCSQAQEEAEPF